MKRNQSKTLRRVLAFILSILIVIATIPFVAAQPAQTNRIVDPSTMDGWKEYFGPDIGSTQNAGAVWMDKSVFTDTSEFPDSVTMTDDQNNFLIALSAIASNKEVVGYSTIPTDTMLVLDVSGSMENNVRSLVTAANSAIKTLLDTNLNNRVGVVLYSGNSGFGSSTYAQGTTLLLPLDRYTTENDRYIYLDDEIVKVSRDLENSNGDSVSAQKAVSGGTYIQSGIYEALKQFENVSKNSDSVVQDNFQDGQKRLPIMVLMSDGAPTTATSNFAEVDKEYTVGSGRDQTTTDASDAGNGGSTTDEMGFLTQLTASYALTKMEEYYDRAGEGLFYTLGLGVGNDRVAQAVLDPSGSPMAEITAHWTAYNNLSSTASLELTVPGTSRDNDNNRNKRVSIYKNSSATNPYYVDQYFAANNAQGLISAFESIVREIIIQSRYYPTSLEGGNPDFSGYIVFEDKIGEYMEVKDIKGILAHGTLYTGAMLTSKINAGTDGLGTVENPTEFGLQFIDAVKTRLGIASNAETYELLGKAWDAGQLYYKNDNDFSNYIGWYATEDGKYNGFYNEGSTIPPEGSVYAVKSYGLLGTAGSSIAPSDMMYMSIQIKTDLITKDQTVTWKIPAALVPLVTYKITLEGTSIETATNVEISYESAEPIRLIFETGLRADINPLNVAQIINERYIADDGVTRQFYTNYWDNSAAEHIDHITTMAGFTPSVQNERYYLTQDSTIYRLEGSEYVPVTDQDHSFSGTYYYARWIFDESSDKPIPFYEDVTRQSLDLRQYDTKEGEWYIPMGTVYQSYESYHLPKDQNNTDSVIFAAYPYVTRTNASYEADVKLGNNGLLFVTPATGIKISKTVDVVEPGASDTFKFKITLSAPTGTVLEDEYPVLIANLDQTTGTESTVKVNDGVIELEIKKDQTVYITELPANTSYTVEELDTNSAYKVKNVHVNGIESVNDIAAGIIGDATLSDIDFVNTPVSEGNLNISKEVTHPFGANYTVPDISFTASVQLTNSTQSMANKSFTVATESGNSTVTTNAQGIFTVALKDGETVAIHNIPEETTYTVTELNIPAGFTLDSVNSSGLQGTIDANSNASAILVNNYVPEEVTSNITVDISKVLTGREWKDSDVFEFVVERLNLVTRETSYELGRLSITDDTAKTLTFDLKNEVYTQAGIYYYRIREVEGTLGGVTYDTLDRRFNVVVQDIDMDGKLEISSVENALRTTVSGDAQNGFKVSVTFENDYSATVGDTAIINVQKSVADDNFQLNGFKFGLYDETGEYPIHESTVTDVTGKAYFEIGYSAADVGKTYKYILKEIHTGINGMNYDAKEYPVSIEIVDNFDGTTSAVTTIEGTSVQSPVPVFTNDYDPTDATVIFTATKSMVGRVLNESEFEFELYKLDSANDTIVGKTPVQTVKNASNGSILFEAVTFGAAGEYYYAVAEKQVQMGGVTCDDRVYVIKVTVEDNNGALVAHADFPQDGILFENIYTVTEAKLNINGTKTLTGRDIVDGEFTFTLTGDDIAPREVKNTGSAVDFGTITYETAGVYRYTVTETKGNEKGITYDDSVYTVTVNVADDGNGALVVTEVSYKKDGLDATSLVFRNGYVAYPNEFVIEGKKVLEGRQMKEGEFEFTLIGGHTTREYETVKNDSEGNFKFTALPVTTAGVFRVRVVEKNTALGGIDYDSSIFTAVITVVDNLKGDLVVEKIEYFKGEEAAPDGIVFNNSYHVSPVEVTIGGAKKLDGRTLNSGEFTFELYEKGETEKIEAVTNDENGVFTFTKLKFEEADTYEYRVVETKGDKYGVTYDETVYNVTVNVTDDGHGSLVAETKMLAEGGASTDTILFNNTFDAEEVKVVITVNKKVDNKTVQKVGLDGFEFVLTDKDNKTIKATTNEQGIATFTLTYEKEDVGSEFTYKLSETKGDIKGMKYSDKVYEYVVKVDYDDDYKLVTTVTKDGKTENALTAEFTNVYEGVTPVEPPSKPDTGDDFSVNAWLAVLFVSGGVIPFAFKKKKDKQED